MRQKLPLLLLTLLVGPTPLVAHPGHLADVAGHDHWVAGAAIGLAVLVGLWGALKGKKTDEAEPAPEPEQEEEAA